ncbi:hypothetical protein ACTWP5_29380 [Streptomyces sp. 4N509B]|uniref:hypothetical protein n=1 Tax=Streptomyces sp. 4N509B TaxID=3457413 RepID=UPI003FD31DA2
MDGQDLETLQAVAGVCVGLAAVLVGLVGWYLPHWQRGFRTTYRPGFEERARAWRRRSGVAALVVALVVAAVWGGYLALAEGELVLGGRFLLAVVQGAAAGLVLAGGVVVALMAVRAAVMAVRRATPYGQLVRMDPRQARRRAEHELTALGEALEHAGTQAPGRQRAGEYLELARRLHAGSAERAPGRRTDPEWEVLFARGAVDAVVAAVLCRTARDALEHGRPVPEDRALCLFNPLHEPAAGTHEMTLEDRLGAYPLCGPCREHVRTTPESEWEVRMLLFNAWHEAPAFHVRFLGVVVPFLDGDTRPAKFVELARAILASAEEDAGT